MTASALPLVPDARVLPTVLAEETALLLDVDGTLLDIAPTPMSVVVPPDLVAALRVLRARLGEALAVITGRPIEQVDTLLGDVPYAVAGEHGGAIRHAPGQPVERVRLPHPPDSWLAAAAALVAAHPGTMLEEKERGFVVHYRAAPQAGPAIGGTLAALIDAHDAAFQLMPASMAWEVRPRGADKGTAVQALMGQPPFAGRKPLFIGDDVTDEDGIRAARALGGEGLRVPESFGTAAGVRAWLAHLAARLAERGA
jgi:trehalose 6-phosphate phosphatase